MAGVPIMFGGHPGIWSLREDERATLGRDTMSLIESLPGEQYERLLKLLEKTMPGAALVYSVATVFGVRVMQQKQLNAMAEAEKAGVA